MEVKPGFKKTEVGVIPEDWGVRRLGEIGEFLKGRGVTRDQSKTGPLPCVRYGELYTVHHNVIRSFTSWISPRVAATALPLCRGDILFAGSGETKEEIGKSAAFVTEGAAYAGGDVVVLRQRFTDPVFLGYALNTNGVNQQKESYGQGDAVVHISAAALAKVRLAIPGLAEQTAIATALSDIDALIDKLDQFIAKKRDLKQAAMQQLLTGKTRLPGFSGEWEVKRLGDVATLNRLNIMPAKQPNKEFTHFSLPAFDAARSPRIELGSSIGSNKFAVPPDAILVSRLNPRIPRVWAPPEVPENAVASTEWLILTPHEGFGRRYLSMLCASPEFCERMELLVTGTTGSHQRINPGTAMNIRLDVAIDSDEQTAITSVLSNMDAEISALEARREKTRAIKQGMMQVLLTGQVRLPVDTEPMQAMA